MRLAYIQLSEVNFKKGGNYNQKQSDVLNRLDNITDFNSIFKFINGGIYNINNIIYGCGFDEICRDYKNLLETGKIN